MNIRRMEVADIASVRAIGDAASELSVTEGNSNFWSERRLSGWLDSVDDVMLVAEIDGTVVGFLITNISKAARIGYLSDLAVHEQYRARGVASALLDRFFNLAREAGVTYLYALTQTQNPKVHELLRKHGLESGVDMKWFDGRL